MATKTKDPYMGLLDINRRIARASAIQQGVGVGKVISPPPEIQIAYNGMVLDKNDIYIDEKWVPGKHFRNAMGHIVSETQPRAGGSGDAAFSSHTHDINNDYTESFIYTDTWQVGDKVEVIPVLSHEDKLTGQQYIISKKLVRLDGN